MVKNLLANAGDAGLIPELGRSPAEGNCQSTPIFLPGKPLGQKSLASCSEWGSQELDSMTQQQKQQPSYIIGRNVNRYHHYGKWCRFLKKLKIELPYDPAIPLQCFYLKEIQSLSQRDSCILIFITVL